MKKLLLGLIMLFAFTYTFSQVEGTWKVAPQAGAVGVGPNQGDISWWSNSLGDVTTRACFFDDKYVFNGDGSFNNVMDNETWVEGWQGISPDQCSTPVYPHDGSNPATWVYDEGAGTLTLDGTGAHLAIPKAVNGFELTEPSQAPAFITYVVTAIDASSMTVDIDVGGGWWRFILAKEAASGEDATLSDLQVDGSTIDGFLPNITDYTYGLPEGTTTVPQITMASPTDPDVSSVVITQATTIPGDATVVVTAGNSTTTMTYTVSYAIVIPLTLPITFENDQVDYGLTDFGGTTSNIITDPSDPSNNIVETLKGDGSETWAGTTVGEPTGLTPAVPFEEGSTIMRINVFSPQAGLPVLFKLEVWDNTSISVETTSYTTVANEWETIYFDFNNENPDTPPLDFANPYNKPVIFFNFGINGAGETFYWDDIKFGPLTSIGENNLKQITFVQNPIQDVLSLNTSEDIESVIVYSLSGQTFMMEEIGHNKYDVSNLSAGLYTVLAIDKDGNKLVGKVLKK